MVTCPLHITVTKRRQCVRSCFMSFAKFVLFLIILPGLSSLAKDVEVIPGVIRHNDKHFTVNKKKALDPAFLKLEATLNTARAVPYLVNNKFSGFQVTSLEKSSPFYLLGIRQGDVLTQVNQVKLFDPIQAILAVQEIKNAKVITIVLLRKGKKFPIVYETE